MAKKSSKAIDVYVEVGQKKAIAGAMDWPGWCRSGKDETLALQALLDYGPRYAKVLHHAKITFQAPKSVNDLNIVERLDGNATTDYGVPGLPPAQDAQPVKGAELERLQTLLKASWSALDAVVKLAAGKELRKGPRGGGRDLDKMMDHVLGAQSSYLSTLGWKPETQASQSKDLHEQIQQAEQNVLAGLQASARGELPTQGPRGGKIWTARYFVRRSIWHLLDHAWEIEDRIL